MVSALTFLLMKKQVFMLTNGYARMPEGFESILYAGLGYTLLDEDADSLIKQGLAVPMGESDAPKIKNSSNGRSGNNNRGKGLPKSRRKR